MVPHSQWDEVHNITKNFHILASTPFPTFLYHLSLICNPHFEHPTTSIPTHKRSRFIPPRQCSCCCLCLKRSFFEVFRMPPGTIYLFHSLWFQSILFIKLLYTFCYILLRLICIIISYVYICLLYKSMTINHISYFCISFPDLFNIKHNAQ